MDTKGVIISFLITCVILVVVAYSILHPWMIFGLLFALIFGTLWRLIYTMIHD